MCLYRLFTMAHIWHSRTADLVLLSPLMSSNSTVPADDHIVAVDTVGIAVRGRDPELGGMARGVDAEAPRLVRPEIRRCPAP